MKKNWLGKTLLVILAVGLLVAGGFALYRIGYAHGAQASFGSEMPMMWAERFDNMPHANGWGEQGAQMPYNHYGSNMMDNYGRTPFSGHMSYRSTGFFMPSLFHLLFWGVIIWLGYKLFNGFKGGRGWHLSLTREPVAPIVNETPAEEA